jgi:hypothetical protein
VKKVAMRVTVNKVPDSRPTVSTSTRHTACSAKAIPIVSSRPTRSDTQPQKIRLPPFAIALNDVAAARAAAGIPHAAAIGPAFAVTSSPPVAIITNIVYST